MVCLIELTSIKITPYEKEAMYVYDIDLPEHGGSLLRFHGSSNGRENGSSSGLHVTVE